MANRKLTLFPGCMIPLRYPQIEKAARFFFSTVGLDFADAEGFTCCPEPWNVKGAGLTEWLTIATRNLCVAQGYGNDVVTLCNGCYSTLKEAQHAISSNGKVIKEIIPRITSTGLPEPGGIGILHFAHVLSELWEPLISQFVKKRPEGANIAIHHGCHLLRPAEIMEFDDPFEPSILEEIIVSMGATPLRYRGYTDCCGRALLDREMSLDIASAKLESMKEAGADCIVVMCPACFEQLDMGQVEIKRKAKKTFGLPVFHFCQLLALACGAAPDSLGFEYHKAPTGDFVSRFYS